MARMKDARMKTAVVNGEPIGSEAINFELDRLVRFYASHGMGIDKIKVGRTCKKQLTI